MPEVPGFINPQLATLKARHLSGLSGFMIKFDGYRVQIHLNNGKRNVYTRSGLDWTKRFSVIAGALDIPGQGDRAEGESQMNVPPLRRGVHWTTEEDDFLREMARSGESVARIAEKLNRATGSVRNRALRLRIPIARSRPVKI